MQNQPHSGKKENLEETFYPSFLFKEIVVMMCIFIFVAIILALIYPVGLGDPADPTDNLFIPKPEWYFLALYQLLKYFPGKLEIIATAIIPLGGIIALFLLPFIDINPERRPARRPIAMVTGLFAVIALVALTVIGLKS